MSFTWCQPTYLFLCTLYDLPSALLESMTTQSNPTLLKVETDEICELS